MRGVYTNMKIYLVFHGEYNDRDVTLCTTDLDLAIKHYIDYAKKDIYAIMNHIEVWEDNEVVFTYYGEDIDIKREDAYKLMKEDFLNSCYD